MHVCVRQLESCDETHTHTCTHNGSTHIQTYAFTPSHTIIPSFCSFFHLIYHCIPQSLFVFHLFLYLFNTFVIISLFHFIIFKCTDRGASTFYFKNFCPRPCPRLCLHPRVIWFVHTITLESLNQSEPNFHT